LRRSREEAARTRRRIVRTAARQFRKRGIDGIGVADVMAKVGLTHGGFYKHFTSKQALVAEACRWALADTRDRMATVAATAPPGRGLEAIVTRYLSMPHRDSLENGCTIAALAGEAAHLDARTRRALAEGFEALAALIAAQFVAGVNDAAMRRARAMLATMVGALTTSRIIADRKRAEEVLRAARAMLLGSTRRTAKGSAGSSS
jgi:TetR/AcrR family transcriptional regulator, transcriptional repressor for nem operon